MRALSAEQLLNVWERAFTARPEQRALELLAAALPEESPAQLAQLSIGRRDEQLMNLRESIFGPSLIAMAVCPKCSQQLDLQFSIDDLRVKSPPAISSQTQNFVLTAEDTEIRFRLPDSTDLEAISCLPDADAAQSQLLGRCILSARRQDHSVSPADLSPEVIAQVVREMERADPQADVQLNLTCPDCSHCWQSVFDILSYFWNEIDVWARRTLREVADLARAYGWRETEILAMSQNRRRLYLELAGT